MVHIAHAHIYVFLVRAKQITHRKANKPRKLKGQAFELFVWQFIDQRWCCLKWFFKFTFILWAAIN